MILSVLVGNPLGNLPPSHESIVSSRSKVATPMARGDHFILRDEGQYDTDMITI